MLSSSNTEKIYQHLSLVSCQLAMNL